MAQHCEHWYEALIDHALGSGDPQIEAHLEQCSGCRDRLVELQQICLAGNLRSWSAPVDLVHRVQGMMASEPKRSVLATLVRTNLGLAGVRSVAQGEIHSIYQADDVTVRMMCMQQADEWRVMGRISDANWNLFVLGVPHDIQADGSFQFTIGSVADTFIELVRWDRVIQIPLPEVVDSDESGQNA